MEGFTCTRCNGTDFKTVTYAVTTEHEGLVCLSCSEELKHFTKYGQAPAVPTPAHPSERAVVWENPADGRIAYPDRNDRVMPDRYRNQGFVRRELSTLRDLQAFEREKNVHSEVAWFDRGSGTKRFDD